MVRRLVEDETVDPSRLEQRQHRTAALTRREGAGRAERVVAADPELCEQRPRVGRREAGRRAEAIEQRLVGGEQLAPLVELAEDDARAERARPPRERKLAGHSAEQRRLARAVPADDRNAIAPRDVEV